MYYCVITSDYCWGKGETLADAIKSARNEGSKITRTGKKVDYVAYEFDANVDPESVFVDGLGSCRWQVREATEPVSMSQGMTRSWVHRDGKDTDL